MKTTNRSKRLLIYSSYATGMVDGWQDKIVLERSGRKTVNLIAIKCGAGESDEEVASEYGIKSGAEFRKGWDHCCSELGVGYEDWSPMLDEIAAFAPWLAESLKNEDEDDDLIDD
jgi:hypothetical protein